MERDTCGRDPVRIKASIRMMPGDSNSSACLLWPSSPLPAAINEGEVQLWAWTFVGAEPKEADLRILDEPERQRTARFYFAPDKVRYSVCHANMRRVLASYLSRPPESLIFRQWPGGKPELVLGAADPPLRFNLSHSKTVAVLAVALSIEVGVDIEDVRPIEPGVADRHFSAAELTSMRPLSGNDWRDAFYRCWTRKEAILKVEGHGLTIPLDSFDVSVLAEEPAALLAARPEAKLTANWHLRHLAAASGTMGALAVGNAWVQVVERSLAL